MIDRIIRLRKYRHLLLTKGGELTTNEKFWLDYLNSILIEEMPDAAE